MITCSYNQTTVHFEDAYEDDWIQIIFHSQFHYSLLAKQPIHLNSFSLTIPLSHSSEARYLMNGFQSWTPCYSADSNTRMHSLNHVPAFLDRKYAFHAYGDYRMIPYSDRKGIVHGWEYCEIQDQGTLDLFASTNERSGYTSFQVDIPHQTLTIAKDLGIDVEGEIPVLEVVRTDSYESVFPSNPQPKLWGYTSWYEHYQNINESLLLENLNALSKQAYSYDVFQIDDGFETFVGDWLSINPIKFPHGLKPLTDAIHSQHMKAGIWLAPFVCETKSSLFQEHPDWIAKDEHGNPIQAGHNWSFSYALDFDHPEVKAYLKKVFQTYIDLGFDFFKLDFLYAVALQPVGKKTRGQRMAEATDFLRECLPEKIILGCGVPLSAAAYKFEYCRIGPDIGPDYDNNAFMRLFHNERVSTKNAIRNTLFRYPLNQRFFGNDPDVYLFNKDIQLTTDQKTALFLINVLFGSVIFTSDQIDRYDPEELDLLAFGRSLHPTHLEVHSICEDRIELQVDSFCLQFDCKHGVLTNLADFRKALQKSKD